MKEIFSEIKSIKESPADLRKFGLTIGIVLLIIAIILLFTGKPSYLVWGILGAAFVLAGLLFPVVLKPFNKLWMSLAIVLGWIMTRVILAILFYIGITGVKLIAMIFNKKFLNLKIDRTAETYWEKREKQPFDPTTYERQF